MGFEMGYTTHQKIALAAAIVALALISMALDGPVMR